MHALQAGAVHDWQTHKSSGTNARLAGFVEQGSILFDIEIQKTSSLVYRATAKVPPAEYMPVRIPFFITVLL